MKFFKSPLSSRVWLYHSTLFAIFSTLLAAHSQAQTYTVPSPNGQSTLQATLSGAGSGLSSWQFAGNSQLAQQWFYYSLGSGAVNSIDQIAGPTSINNHGGAAPFLSTVYSNANISVTAKFSLNNLPTLSDTLTILNPLGSGQTQTFHFYQYSDFDLGGAAGGQTVQFSNNGSGVNYQVNQGGLGGVSLQGVISGAGFSLVRAQAGVFSGSQFGLGNGNPAPVLDNTTLVAGPGDAVYAYEWDETLAPGDSFQISELQTVSSVPEPSSIALLVLGVGAFWVMTFRRGRTNGSPAPAPKA